MNEYQEPYEKEISLKELIFYCLKQWRWIVAAMLLLAIAAGAWKYRAVVQENAEKKEAEESLAAEESDDESEESGDEDGVIANPNIEYYNLAIENAQEELDKLKEYMDSSVIMSLEAYQLDTGTLTYYIDADGGSNALCASLASAYENFVEDGRLVKELRKADDSISASELQYLLTFESKTLSGADESLQQADDEDMPVIQIAGSSEGRQNVFTVQITATDEDSCAAYMEAAKEAIGSYAAELQGSIGVHELTLLSEAQTERIDQDIQTYQTGVLNSYTTLFDKLNNLQDSLDTVKEEEGETIVVSTAVSYANPVTAAVKYAVVGLVLGAFLAAFVLVVLYLLSGKLESVEQFKEEFEMPLLGQITKQPSRRRLFGFVDRWLQRLEEGAYADITYEEQLKLAAANVRTAAGGKEGLTKIMIAGSMGQEEARNFSSQLAQELSGIMLSDYQRIVFSSASLEEVASYDAVLFLEKLGASYNKLIQKERELVADRDVKILGAIVL